MDPNHLTMLGDIGLPKIDLRLAGMPLQFQGAGDRRGRTLVTLLPGLAQVLGQNLSVSDINRDGLSNTFLVTAT